MSTRNAARRIALALVLAVLAAPATTRLVADLVELKNGEKLKGDVLAQDASTVRLKTLLGEVTVRKDEIRRIVLETPTNELAGKRLVNAFLRDGRFHRGWLLREEADRIVLRTVAGDVTVLRSDLRNIDERRELYLEEKRFTYPLGAALWRSAVLPGWGQFWMARPTKGWIFATATGAFLGGAIGTYAAWRSATDSYNARLAAGTYDKALFDHAAKLKTWNNVLFTLTLVAYGANLADAALFRGRPGPADGLAFEPRGDGGALAYSARF